MAQELKSGEDVTDLMNVKSGDDVTQLMGSEPETPQAQQTQEQPSGLRELIRSGYEKMMSPLAPEADTSGTQSGLEGVLHGGFDVGANVPGLNKIWPGGIHVPGMSEVYNELIRPMTSPFGIGTMGLEGAIAGHGALTRPHDIPLEEAAPILERPKPLGLPPARSIDQGTPGSNLPYTLGNILQDEQNPRFIAGEGGIAENKPYQSKAGTIVPPDLLAREGENLGVGSSDISTGLGNAFDPAEIAEQQRIANLGYTVQDPGSALQIPNRSLDIPVESGNTSLGFNPQSEGDLPYPLNVVPNLVRPRTVQSNMANETQMPILERLGQQQPNNPLRELEPSLSAVSPEYPVRSIESTGEIKDLPYQLPSAVKPSRVFADAPAPIEEITAAKLPETPIENVLPQPGSAKPSKDVSAFGAYFTSPDITLGSRPITKPIADAIVGAQDSKMQWIASTERELADLSKGLNKAQRIQLGQMIDGQTLTEINPDLQARAEQARMILDNIHAMFPEGATKSGENVGYLENYFTHIHDQPEDIKSAVQSVIDHHFGPFQTPQEPLEETPSGIGDMYERGLGRPGSPYVEPRQDLARKINYDVNKVFPAYIESAAKVIFDKPAVELAKKQLAKIPDSNLKELATAYIKNYTRYDSMPGLDHAWNSWASRLARTTSRSLLGWNTGLQTLHLARLTANMFPELGAKYSSIGLKEVATHPIQAWTEAAKLGLLQNEVRPFSFKTPMERYDSISQFLSVADYLDKAIGYHGYKAKFTAEGLSSDAASMAALRETKRVSQTVDPARQMLGFTPPAGGNPIGTAAVRLGAQFKQVPAKIVEQYINIAKNVKDNPKAAARLVAGVGLALAADQQMRTFHLSPTQMIPTDTWGAFGTTVTKVVNALKRGDWEKAVLETGLWATPGGKSIQRQIEQGPSAFNP